MSEYALSSAGGAPYATAVPEPASLWLVGGGALGLFMRVRRLITRRRRG